MRKAILSVVCLMLASSVFGQQFSIGGKYSNYETELSAAGASIDTDRENSLGFVLEYRNERFVLKGQLDHDFESGLGVFDVFDLADYERDRIEISAGYGVTPNIDIDFAVRIDSLQIDTFFFDEFSEATDMDQEAIGAGLTFHSDPAADFGVFLMGRGYIGNAEFGIGPDVDTTGFRIEGGLPIRIGGGNWRIVPGVEWERFETDDILSVEGFEFETNRLVFSFIYSM
ncbi:MAG: hypothetical protein R3338_07230 [Thermoanaerobaculia bacterium]|nr:hypothetical protein [Thermoanaerobaculia bacterium]